MKKIIVRNEKGEILKTYNSMEKATKEEGVSVSTISRSARGITRKTHGGRYYEVVNIGRIKHNTKRRAVIQKDLSGNVICRYENQNVMARHTGYTAPMINHWLRGVSTSCISKGFTLEYEDVIRKKEKEEIKEETKEIVKPTKEEYYVNILVGLVNGTLIEGATYDLMGTKARYNKRDEILETFSGTQIISKNTLIQIINIELPLLTEKERDFLNNILKAFSNVKGIRKCNDIKKGFEFIRIETSIVSENVDLPCFVEGKYYSSLKQNRLYTLEELNL